ncbi:hypothetical protein SYNPS1DRAFT_30771 [Syncephalis pseudoplumigaleata]|uniref:FAS1 domain-containing protein n=1 Tax=Syncephalis pseudoplumigaleata TaxID=1712513 RepID=A0A4V1J115_9FUNG|nr:hypothetical protein SYNPS1DRAFT_30771 [Syncephalis pseudoplumigaleata]|eukprot:RKP23479.1 hypothetical protein SYNPS1DRAFT_30771 [Syncephalis pseudoplumigaleata]
MYHHHQQRWLPLLQWILLATIIGLALLGHGSRAEEAQQQQQQQQQQQKEFASVKMPKLLPDKSPTRMPGHFAPLHTTSGIDVNNGTVFSNHTVMDMLNDIKNLSSFRQLIQATPGYAKAFGTTNERFMVFVPSNHAFTLVDGWQSRTNTTDGQAYLRYTVAYHVVAHAIDLGAVPRQWPWPLPTLAVAKKGRASLMIYVGEKDAQVNCATIIAPMINVKNGAIVVVDQPLDPWLEAPKVADVLYNKETISCKALNDKAKRDMMASSSSSSAS